MSVALLAAWADTRLALHMDAAALSVRRARLWNDLRTALARTPALARYAAADIHDVPVVDPATMRADPHAWNSAGIGRDEAMAAAHDAERGGTGIVRGDIVAGLSTGTAGERGLFLASARERELQIGQSIARLLPWHAPLTGARIALVLRADSEIYRTVARGRFDFQHIPLGLTGGEMLRRIRDFGPTVLISPPRELADLARTGERLPGTLARIFWGSEPMAPAERHALTHAFGLRPDPIYQATEGFIASSCPYGTLHLNEDSIHVELEAVAGTDLYRPIVTDLRRRTQPMVRVRLDDLVRPVSSPCGCGSGRRAIDPVAGRVQDIWTIRGRRIAPDAVDDHFTRSLPDLAAWRVTGSGGAVVAHVVEPLHVDAMRSAIRTIHPEAEAVVETVPELTGAKRRRVRWKN